MMMLVPIEGDEVKLPPATATGRHPFEEEEVR